MINRKDIKYVRKIDRSHSNCQIFTVQYSSDNIQWFDLLDYPPEWLCDLIVQVLQPKQIYEELDVELDPDDEVELDPEVIRKQCDYSW